MDEVATNSGISRQRLYCYFHNLDEIAYRIQIADMKQFVSDVQAGLIASKGPSCKARLEAMLRRMLAYEQSHSEDFLFTSDFDMYYRRRQVDSALRKEYEATYQDLEFTSAIGTFLAEGKASGEFRADLDPAAATSFWANLLQLVLERIAVFSSNGEVHSEAELKSLERETLYAFFAYIK